MIYFNFYFKIEILEDVHDFLSNLPSKMKAKVDRTIALLGQYRYKLQMPYSKKIVGTKNLYELRTQQSSNICRLFYFYYKDKIYWLFDLLL